MKLVPLEALDNTNRSLLRRFAICTALLLVLVVPGLAASGALTSKTVSPQFATGAAYNLSNDSGDAIYPMVANAGSHVYVVWTERSGGILLRASSNNGSTWSPSLSQPAMKISAGSTVANYPVIAANGSNVYVSWAQSISGTLQIMFASSTNYGASFNAPLQITRSGGETPVLAGWGNDVYVAYTTSGGASYVNSSTNAGATWTKKGFQISFHHEPQLAAYGSYAYAVADSGLAVSNNNGTSWTKKTLNTLVHSEPWIAAYGSNVYVTWETKGRTSVVQASYSTNNGNTWSNVITLTKYYPDAWAPMIAAYGSYVYVAFHTHPGSVNAREYVITSNNDWATNTTSVLSAKKHDASFPFNVAVSGSTVFVMWDQEVNATTGTWNAMLSYSTNSGATWPKSPPGFDMSSSPNAQEAPEDDIATGSLASFANHAFAAWQNASASATYSQIYFTSS